MGQPKNGTSWIHSKVVFEISHNGGGQEVHENDFHGF